MALSLHNSQDCVLRYKSGSNWLEVQGISGFSSSGGDAPTRTVTTFRESATITGTKPPPSLSFEVQAYSPVHQSWQFLKTKAADGSSVEFRVETKSGSDSAVASGTGGVALSVITAGETGPVTITSAASLTYSNIGAGMILQTGAAGSAQRFLIEGSAVASGEQDVPITASGFLVRNFGAANSTAVTNTTAWSIYVPKIRYAFTASVGNSDLPSIAADGTLSTTLTLNPTADLPQAVVVV